jgi:hypothetical protein
MFGAKVEEETRGCRKSRYEEINFILFTKYC